MTGQTMLDHALRELQLGGYVFPLVARSKIPFGRDHRCRSGHQHERGFRSATNDPDIVRAWWRAHPDANIGVDLECSGQVLLDYDRRSNPSGTALEELYTAIGPLPETRVTLGRRDGSSHGAAAGNARRDDVSEPDGDLDGAAAGDSEERLR